MDRIRRARPLLALLSALTAAFALGCSAPPGRPDEGASGGQEGGQGRIAFVDMERVLRDTPQGVEAMADFERLGRRLQQELDDMRDDLREQEREIEAARERGAPDEELARLVADYQEAAGRAQQALDASQQQLQQLRAQLTAPLLEDVARIVRRIGRDEGYALILDRSGAQWIDPGADISARVVEAYREESGEEAGGEPLGGEDGEGGEDEADGEGDASGGQR